MRQQKIFREYESYCEDGHANTPVTDDPVELIPFERSVDNAISCIEWRAMKVFNKYIENGTIEQVERRFRAFYEGQCLIPHAEIEVSYLSNAYGLWKTFTIKI